MMENIDINMGRLDSFLSENNLLDNTIVIFTTDNGPVGGFSTYTAGLRGTKGSPWEGGHRVPLFIKHPSGGLVGGRTIEGLTTIEDLFPTLLDLCSVPVPENANFDGISLAPALRDEAPVPDRQLVVQINRGKLDPKSAAILWRNWRVLWGDNLYDLTTDPGQEKNIINERPDIFAKMWKDYQSWYNKARPAGEEMLPEHIGHGHQEVIVLDGSHAPGGADGQPPVRTNQMKKNKQQPPHGAWFVRAHAAGRYRISLTRWPLESGLALTDGTPAFVSHYGGKPQPEGKALQIDSASLEINNWQHRQAIGDDPQAIHFDVELSAGDHHIRGLFWNQQQLVGSAFYAYITGPHTPENN